MFNVHIFTVQVGASWLRKKKTVLPFIPEAPFRIPVGKVVAVTISSATPATFLGTISN
jgi:hypothetical protein